MNPKGTKKMEAYIFAKYLVQICMSLVFIKAVLGYKFPWEICECCGKPQREHTNGTHT